MPGTCSLSIAIWRKALGTACAAYFALVWALPTLTLSFLHQLPFVNERDTSQRLIFSILGTLLVACAMALLTTEENWRHVKAQEPEGSAFRKLAHWAAVFGGVAFFTYGVAATSGNMFGLISRVLPNKAYKETVVLESVEFSKHRYRSVSLQYRSQVDGATRYLVLSERFFDYPRFAVGDVVELSGEQSLVGVYIKDFRREQATQVQ